MKKNIRLCVVFIVLSSSCSTSIEDLGHEYEVFNQSFSQLYATSALYNNYYSTSTGSITKIKKIIFMEFINGAWLVKKDPILQHYPL